MPITVTGTASTSDTLATTLKRIEIAADQPATGDYLEVTWPSASQDAANLIRVRLSDGDDGDAVAADDLTYHPGSAYRVVIPIRGAGSVCIAGASAFAVVVRVGSW